MRLARQRLICAMLWGCLTVVLCFAALGSEIAVEAQRIDRIKKTVLDSLCYDVYWNGGWGTGAWYQRGTPLPLKLWIDGNKFFALIDPIGFVGKRRKPIQAKRFGIDNGDRAVVTSAYAPKLEQSILTKQPIIDTLVIPKDCTPNYDPASPKKEIMLKTVVGTIQIKLSNFVRQGIAKYPRNLTILIADFNVDYPSTYVRVEGINEVYSVTLHDFENYDSDQFEREGEYPSGEVYNKPKELLAKIHKHGIKREIAITP